MSEWIGLLIACALTVAIGLGVRRSGKYGPALLKLILLALALRVFGAVMRYEVLAQFYGGVGDAMAYFRDANRYADAFWNLDLSPITDTDEWRNGNQWWGTTFVAWPTALVVMLVGESMRGGFVVFSLLSFAGLCGCVGAFARSFQCVPVERYARWVWLFPSLWFWPSSIGKDALILCGIGLFVYGFIGRRDPLRPERPLAVSWIWLVLGGALVFAVRPQVAAVVIASAMGSIWLGTVGGSRRTKWFEIVAVGGAGLVGLYLALGQLGISGFDSEGVGDYLDQNTNRGDYGGSGFETGVEVGGGWSNIPVAFFNILFRPLPWEAHNITSLISAVEIWGFWAIAWIQRKRVWLALKGCLRDRLLRFAIIFILLYATLLGLLIANAGIIARQRIFLFPFLFMFFEAVPVAATVARQRLPRPRRRAVGVRQQSKRRLMEARK